MRNSRDLEHDALRVGAEISVDGKLLGHEVTSTYYESSQVHRVALEEYPELEARGPSRALALESLAELLTLPHQVPS